MLLLLLSALVLATPADEDALLAKLTAGDGPSPHRVVEVLGTKGAAFYSDAARAVLDEMTDAGRAALVARSRPKLAVALEALGCPIAQIQDRQPHQFVWFCPKQVPFPKQRVTAATDVRMATAIVLEHAARAAGIAERPVHVLAIDALLQVPDAYVAADEVVLGGVVSSRAALVARIATATRFTLQIEDTLPFDDALALVSTGKGTALQLPWGAGAMRFELGRALPDEATTLPTVYVLPDRYRVQAHGKSVWSEHRFASSRDYEEAVAATRTVIKLYEADVGPQLIVVVAEGVPAKHVNALLSSVRVDDLRDGAMRSAPPAIGVERGVRFVSMTSADVKKLPGPRMGTP